VVQRHEIRVVREGKPGDMKTEPLPPIDIRKSEFERFDADKDGKVSFAEYEGRQRTMLIAGFEMLDADKDKALTLAEYSRINTPMKMVTVSDTDGKSLTEDLRPAISDEKIKAQFGKLDKNSDGKLSLAEYLPPS